MSESIIRMLIVTNLAVDTENDVRRALSKGWQVWGEPRFNEGTTRALAHCGASEVHAVGMVSTNQSWRAQ